MEKRLFIGIPLTALAREQVSEQVSQMAENIPGKLTKPENWHLTLFFLGMTSEEKQARLREELKKAPLGAPFEIVLGGLGAFPNARRGRVFWMGVATGMETLAALAGEVSDRAERAGFTKDPRDFNAHLTLSRVSNAPKDMTALVNQSWNPVILQVGRVVLFWSRPSTLGVLYEEVESYALG